MAASARVSVDTRRLKNLAMALRSEIPEEVSKAFAERTHENINENWSGIAPPRSSPGEPPAIDTGELARNTKVEQIDGSYTVSSGTIYAEMLEYGTSKMAARPYLLPAMEQTADEAEKIVDYQSVVNKSI